MIQAKLYKGQPCHFSYSCVMICLNFKRRLNLETCLLIV